MKELFQIKKTVNYLPSDRISRKLFIVLLFTLIPFLLVFIDAFIQLAEGALKSAPNLQNVNILSFYVKYTGLAIAVLIFDAIVCIVIAIIFSWLIKKILSLFKKSITLYKMLNIFIYTLLVYNILGFIIIFPGYLEKRIFSSIFEDTSSVVVDNLILGLYIFCFFFYIYAIKISTSSAVNGGGEKR